MNFRGFLRQLAAQFFVITTCVTAATAIIGPCLMPGRMFGFSMFYSPLIAGLIGTLPGFVLYSRKELDLRRTLLRRALHLILLEGVLTGFALLNGNIHDLGGAMFFMLMVLLVYVAATVIRLALDGGEARKINRKLKTLQNRQ